MKLTHSSNDRQLLKLYDVTTFQVVDLLFASEILEDTTAHLQVIIIEQHTQFVKLYLDCSIISKMHYQRVGRLSM